MNELEERLLREETGGAEPRHRILTGTRIDLGRWWRSTPVWLCVVGNELVLLAVARRRYFERVPLAECQGSHYVHATGELVIDPTDALRIKHLSMSPREALEVLDFLKS
jgi:hypothetical protein